MRSDKTLNFHSILLLAHNGKVPPETADTVTWFTARDHEPGWFAEFLKLPEGDFYYNLKINYGTNVYTGSGERRETEEDASEALKCG
ncbi:MAG: hypothetical protein ACLFPE_07655 [Bacteroidales bacterium]